MDKNNNKQELIAWLWSGLFGFLVGAFLVLGYQLETGDSINLSDKNTMLVMAMLMIILTLDTRYVWRGYDLARQGKKLFGYITLRDLKANPSVHKKDFFKNWLCMGLLSIPVFMAEFPGFFVYDAQEELNEVLTRSFTTHHPLFHVLLMGGIIALVHKVFGSWNFGIFCYLFLQMLVITAIFAYAVTFMQKKGIGKRSRILWVLYYGAFPTIVMYTLCSSKDGLFSALLLLVTVLLIEMVADPEKFFSDKRKVIAYVLAATFMPLFRHNGFYAYVVFIPFGLLYFRKKLKPLLIGALVGPAVLYLVLNAGLSAACLPEGVHHQEMLTVPIMQLARLYTYEKENIPAEDLAIIEAYIPEENLKLYTPRVSDLVKVGFNNSLYEENSKDFWDVWKKYLVKHPMVYVNAWALTSYGYVYPPAVINVYGGTTVYTFTYDRSSYFGYEVELPGERKGVLKPLDDLYRYLSIGTFQEDMPIPHILFTPGLFIILFMYVIFYRLSKGRFNGVVPFIPMLLTFCTVLLGPTYLVRYVVYLWLCVPLLGVTGKDALPA